MTEAILLQLHREKTIFWSLLGVLFLCTGFYIYFINATVHNVVMRQNFEDQSTQLVLSIGNKEFEYITMRNSVTMDLARTLGFMEVSDKLFISKKPVTQVSYLSQ